MNQLSGSLDQFEKLLVRSRCIGKREQLFYGITADSRNVRAGDLFLCLPGATVDGHDYAEQAIAKGAVALVVERELNVSVPQLIVPSVREAQAWIANAFYEEPSRALRVIGVTGTNGKTTTTYLLEHILNTCGHKIGLMGTIRMTIGDKTVPTKNTTMDAIDLQSAFREMKEAGCSHAVMEVSSHALALGRVKGVRFRTGIFTNLTQDHLDFHGDMATYQEAKGLLFARMDQALSAKVNEAQFAIINADDPASASYQSVTAAQVIRYGVQSVDADVRAINVQLGLDGTKFRLETFKGNMDVHIRLFGMFNVYNVLAAISAALVEGLDLEKIVRAVERMNGVDGRFEPVLQGQPFLAVVDYAHTPDSLENVLRTAREFTQARVLCLFGCGGDRDRTKRPIMARIACEQSDFVVITSDNPRSEDPERILDDVYTGVVLAPHAKAQVVERMADRAEAIQRIISFAQAGDIVVIAGKGHETYQIIQGVNYPFDDREEVRKALRANGYL